MLENKGSSGAYREHMRKAYLHASYMPSSIHFLRTWSMHTTVSSTRRLLLNDISLFLAFPSIAAQPLLLRPHFVTKTSTWETSNFSSVKENRLHRPISRGFRTTLPHAEDYRTPPKYTLSV